jgi:hypothetical protein
MTSYQLKPSGKATKKYDLIITPETGRSKTVSFGAKGMSDFTKHHDDQRKARYLKRHQKEKDRWSDTKDNLKTASYLAKNILWNKPTIDSSVKDVERR